LTFYPVDRPLSIKQFLERQLGDRRRQRYNSRRSIAVEGSIARMDESYDWTVVGSAGSSICSALVMRALGKSMVIPERSGPASIGASAIFGYIAARHANDLAA
jgi:hypothetical protein